MRTCLRKIGILAAVAVAVIGITGCWISIDGGKTPDTNASDTKKTDTKKPGAETPEPETPNPETPNPETPNPETPEPTIPPAVPENFVRVPGISIRGDETWTPFSNVFVSGRMLEIKPFFMSDHEVTRAEYKKVIGSDPSVAKAHDKDGHELTGDAAGKNPVNCVSWYDALVYCNKLSIEESFTPCYKIGGSTNPDDWGAIPVFHDDAAWNAATCDFEANGYRLPTEAEWEWAARGGQNYTYAGSDNIDDVEWYKFNISKTGTRDVKTKKKNGYELYDMSGNVWELCWDWREDISNATPNTGASSGSYRCSRGGSWHDAARYAGFAYRDRCIPGCRYYSHTGFRLVRSAN